MYHVLRMLAAHNVRKSLNYVVKVMVKSSHVNVDIVKNLSAFEARRKKESGGKVDKRTVQKYMKQQNKEEEPINTALADALKKLNLK